MLYVISLRHMWLVAAAASSEANALSVPTVCESYSPDSLGALTEGFAVDLHEGIHITACITEATEMVVLKATVLQLFCDSS
jgi:hypothetical protein